MQRRYFLAAVVSLATLPRVTFASQWPTRPLRMLVGFPAGSSTDLLARTLAEPLALALGKPVVVENRVGAAGNIAADLLAKSADDHTIGIVTTGPLTTAKLLNDKLPFDPERDLAPITLVGSAPMVLTSPTDIGVKTASELLAKIKMLGEKANFASVGVGSAAHLCMELLISKTGITPTHVPYAGAPQIVPALIRGEVQLAFMAPAAAMPQAKAGKLRAWAVTTQTRSSLVPELPTLVETGVADFNFESWNAVCAPTRMSAPYRIRIEQELLKIINTPEMLTKLSAQDWLITTTGAESLSARIREDRAAMARLIRERRISL